MSAVEEVILAWNDGDEAAFMDAFYQTKANMRMALIVKLTKEFRALKKSDSNYNAKQRMLDEARSASVLIS